MATRARVEISVSSATTKCASVRNCELEYEPECESLNAGLNATNARERKEERGRENACECVKEEE